MWYRPIEILLGQGFYHKEVDIWSLGSLMIEIFCKKAPFRGRSEIGQIFEIFKVKGSIFDSNSNIFFSNKINIKMIQKKLKNFLL